MCSNWIWCCHHSWTEIGLLHFNTAQIYVKVHILETLASLSCNLIWPFPIISNYPVPLASSRHFLNNRLERIITDLYTYPVMAKRIFFLAKQIRPLQPTMSDSLFTCRWPMGSGLYTINVFVLTACSMLLLTNSKFVPVTPFKDTN
jgi:hypothetical protein